MKCAAIRIACLLLVLMTAAGIYAQVEEVVIMKKICAAYNTVDAISFNSDMKMYSGSNPKKIIEKSHSTYTLQGVNFICRSGSSIMLLNDKYCVAADNMLKLIVVGRRNHLSGTALLPVLNLVQLKSLVSKGKITASILTDNDKPVLQLADPQEVSGCRLYKIAFDERSYFLKNVIVEIADSKDADHKTMVLETSYSTPFANQEKNKMFSEKTFFTIVRNRIVLAGNYKRYQIINQL
ncbi:MAG: hypothetical protein ABIQ88_16600 [Chitinophagaceae bacterium]